jgi:hypothetical protein
MLYTLHWFVELREQYVSTNLWNWTVLIFICFDIFTLVCGIEQLNWIMLAECFDICAALCVHPNAVIWCWLWPYQIALLTKYALIYAMLCGITQMLTVLCGKELICVDCMFWSLHCLCGIVQIKWCWLLYGIKLCWKMLWYLYICTATIKWGKLCWLLCGIAQMNSPTSCFDILLCIVEFFKWFAWSWQNTSPILWKNKSYMGLYKTKLIFDEKKFT